ESLNRVRGLFDDDKDSGSLSGFSSVKTPKNLSGFSSGSGRYIGSLSEDQLNKARRLFDEKAPCSNYTHKPNTPKRTIDIPPNRHRLQDIVHNYPLNISATSLKKLGIPSEIITMTPASALSYRFLLSEGQYCESTEGLSSWGASEAYTCLIE
ncbi:14572_t:CDS:2, partial [Racocetra persica]